jgi:hypothetical protein
MEGPDMRASRCVRCLLGLTFFTGVAALPACVQPRVAELSKQVEATTRYAARMEELYASQEVEILSLREQLATLQSRSGGE